MTLFRLTREEKHKKMKETPPQTTLRNPDPTGTATVLQPQCHWRRAALLRSLYFSRHPPSSDSSPIEFLICFLFKEDA